MKLQYNPGVPTNNRCLSVLSAISTELCIDLLFLFFEMAYHSVLLPFLPAMLDGNGTYELSESNRVLTLLGLTIYKIVALTS